MRCAPWQLAPFSDLLWTPDDSSGPVFWQSRSSVSLEACSDSPPKALRFGPLGWPNGVLKFARRRARFLQPPDVLDYASLQAGHFISMSVRALEFYSGIGAWPETSGTTSIILKRCRNDTQVASIAPSHRATSKGPSCAHSIGTSPHVARTRRTMGRGLCRRSLVVTAAWKNASDNPRSRI